MSTFSGLLTEINGVSVDCFLGDNLYSSIYFLSHCHEDHMRGLPDLMRYKINKREHVFLYGSPVTIRILINRYPDKADRLKELEVGVVHCLRIPNTPKMICVTLIPAGHCPGSVMFLFETEKRILYTGDIRLTVNEIKKCKAFHDLSGKLKKIDKIYLDTTFFKKSFRTCPTREESMTEFINILTPWLKEPNNYVQYIVPAKYGTEYLYIETAKKLNMPIHVTQEQYETYKYIPEMDTSITTDPKKTQIHACGNYPYNLYNFCNVIQEVSSNNRMRIKSSFYRWENNDFKNGIIEKEEKNSYFVCYSSHCSYSELVEILYYLKPKRIYPSVLKGDEKQKTDMLKLIDETLKDIHKEDTNIVDKEYVKTDWLLSQPADDSCEDDEDMISFLAKQAKKKQKVE